jgi:Bacterial flagellin C-terminal helical region
MLDVREQPARLRLPVDDQVADPDPVAAETETVEQPRCPTCSAIRSDGESFCTSCGLPFDGFAAGTSDQRLLSRTVEGPSRASLSTPRLGRGRRIAILTAISLLVLGLITAVALFATAWHQQTAKKRAAEASLSTTRSQLGATQGRLRQSHALLARQQTILKQTATVLRKVDPLLSGADQLQQITAQIQTARDTFAGASLQMTSDLIYLENVLANPSQFPGVDPNALVDPVNAELAAVRSDLSTLASYDGNFANASGTFGRTASVLTTAVRQLQRELKVLATSRPSTP